MPVDISSIAIAVASVAVVMAVDLNFAASIIAAFFYFFIVFSTSDGASGGFHLVGV